MIKNCKILFLLVAFVYGGNAYSLPNVKSLNWKQQRSNQATAKLSPQVEFFAGVGYYNPSLKVWNDAIKDFHSYMEIMGGEDLQEFWQVKDGGFSPLEDGLVDLGTYTKQSSNELKANGINHLGIKYFFTPKLSLSLSVAYYNASASTKYFAEAQGVEKAWPNFGYSVSDQLTISQEIKTYPTLFTVYYDPSLPFMEKYLNFYVGGGVGFYFSTVTTDISKEYIMDHSKGNANWEMVEISSDPVNSDIISNIIAKANPFGYHVSAGLNFGFKNMFVNVEVGYNFAKAKLDEEDWTFFTRNYTPVKTFEGKNYSAASETHETIYQETRKYFLEMPERAYDRLKIKELDFSGLILKGGIGFSF